MIHFLYKNRYNLTIALLFIIFIIFSGVRERSFNAEVDELKNTILKKDSLVKVREGEFTKLVNDTKSKKELDREVKGETPKTYEDIKKSKEKIISHTKIKLVPVSKTIVDTVYIDSSGTKKFTSFYPEKNNYFIKNFTTIINNEAKTEWSFTPLKVNIVVTEQKDGMYRARLSGPEWIQAEEVTINSLPLNPVTERKFKFLLGASGGYDFNTRTLPLGVYTGFRVKNKILILNGQTNKVVTIGYIQEF